MKVFLTFMLLFSLSDFLLSQTDFREGFIIQNTGDTLFALVSYREGSKAYKSCYYRLSEDQPVGLFKPGEIQGFGFPGYKYFETRQVEIMEGDHQVLFFEVLVRGYVTLYKHEGNYWVQKQGDSPILLKNELKETVIDDRTVHRYTNQYLGILNLLLFDCEDLREEIAVTALEEKPLTRLVERYNQCSGLPFEVYKSDRPWVRYSACLRAGYNYSMISFYTENESYSYLTGSYEPYGSLFPGISVDISSPRISDRFSFHTGILYIQSRYYGYNLTEKPFTTERNYITLCLKQIKFPVGIRYTFREKGFAPFIFTGITGTLNIKSSTDLITEMETAGIVETYRSEALELKKNQLGICVGIGAVKSVSTGVSALAELRYEYTNGISLPTTDPFSKQTSRISNIQLHLGIIFN